MRRSIWITVFLILSLVFFILFYLFDPFQVPPNVTITQSNVKVVRANQHPFLIDHEKLIVVEFDGRRIDEKMGYVDPGAGCNSHLFEDEEKFILFECNGTRYDISKQGGKIECMGWTWMEKLPEKYVGIFQRQRGQIEYLLTEQHYPELSEVYRSKDPYEYRNKDICPVRPSLY